MPAEDSPADSPFDSPIPEASPPARRLRRQSQLEFELDFYGRILERDPFHTSALRAHANNLAAAGQWVRALQLDRRLVRLQPEKPIPWYNLACSYAVLGLTDPAFFALQRAVELGYRPLRRISKDPDLKSLRRDPRFARLIRKSIGGWSF